MTALLILLGLVAVVVFWGVVMGSVAAIMLLLGDDGAARSGLREAGVCLDQTNGHVVARRAMVQERPESAAAMYAAKGVATTVGLTAVSAERFAAFRSRIEALPGPRSWARKFILRSGQRRA